ncbi:hypothetical protein AVEN_32522-1 [Araneus ventricosus]|uniref:Uncharacterized protein n=1 Tax=Araneus ventricosus TaxID=182803 RepID=A0A4Y2G732_ARAVE|nr:hypothetical protein AVEN_32522-1 [Araneus ventricosus]
MDVQIIVINGLQIPFRIAKISVDGEYLFSSLSYLVCDDVSMMAKIHTDTVSHVSNNLQRFKCFIQQRSGFPYGTEHQYLTEMPSPELFIDSKLCIYLTC